MSNKEFSLYEHKETITSTNTLITNPLVNQKEPIISDKMKLYTEEEVERLLITQRGNCYVAILSATKDQKLAELASKAPEPWSWRK